MTILKPSGGREPTPATGDYGYPEMDTMLWDLCLRPG